MPDSCAVIHANKPIAAYSGSSLMPLTLIAYTSASRPTVMPSAVRFMASV